MTASGVLGVIVAAGTSDRMGQPKQLLPIGDRPMLEVAVGAAEASRLDRVVVVTHGSEVRKRVAVDRAQWADNPDPAQGSISSFRVGLEAGGQHAAAMLLAGDQPEVTAAIVDTVIDAWRSARPWAMRTRYRGGTLGQPFVFSWVALDDLDSESGDKVLWRRMEESAAPVEEVAIDADAPRDINTREDYLAVCARLGVTPASDR